MIKYKIGIQLVGEGDYSSAIIVFNCNRSEITYDSWIQTGDILNLFEDFKVPAIGTLIKISKSHPVFIELKNMGYTVSEV
jgi:hypothetical protein